MINRPEFYLFGIIDSTLKRCFDKFIFSSFAQKTFIRDRFESINVNNINITYIYLSKRAINFKS